jgi:site-specific recombinase XerD
MVFDDLLNAFIENSNLATQRRQQGDQAAGPERLGFYHGCILDCSHRPSDAGYASLNTFLTPAVLLVKNAPQRARHSQLSVLRQFCRFLFQLDPESYIPEWHLLPAAKSDFQPHIYTMNEVVQLMEAARGLPPAGSLRPHTYSTLIGLLWATGLRGGELVRLNIEDVDLDKGILHIRQTKNFKSRLVPLAESTRMALLAYRDLRARLGMAQHPHSPFFINERRHRCARRTVIGTFRMLTRQLGLKSAYGREPRLHDLRHTWATRSLAGIYESGQDPNAALPVLATYLGHVNIACTTIYLHPATELLVQAGARFLDHVTAITTGGGDE